MIQELNLIAIGALIGFIISKICFKRPTGLAKDEASQKSTIKINTSILICLELIKISLRDILDHTQLSQSSLRERLSKNIEIIDENISEIQKGIK